jgi:hypothetical protein
MEIPNTEYEDTGSQIKKKPNDKEGEVGWFVEFRVSISSNDVVLELLKGASEVPVLRY